MNPLAILVVPLGYLLGSFPSGYLAGQWCAGVDIRQLGSGSTGATNVLRQVGKGPALVVFLVDVFKGSAAVIVARGLLGAGAPGAYLGLGVVAAVMVIWRHRSNLARLLKGEEPRLGQKD